MTDNHKATIMVGGKYASFDVGDNQKAITSIPGWARAFNQRDAKGGDGSLMGKSSWAYRCIEIRSDALASLPWKIVDENGEEVEGTDLHSVVHNIPEIDTFAGLLKTTMADLDIYGQAFWLKVRNQDSTSEPLGLQRLNPSSMSVEAGSTGISHFVQEVDGEDRDIDRDDIVFFRTYDPNNDFGGLSPLQVVADDIRAEAEADQYLEDFFSNYAIPPVIFSTKEDVRKDELKEAERRWLKKFRGPGKRHKTTFTSKGLEPKEIGYSISDLAMDVVREESRRAICAAFGVPMPLAGASEAANYATMTEQRKSMYTETILPIGERAASTITSQLVAEFDENWTFVFDPARLSVLQPDRQKERESYARLVEAGVITPEAAARELGFDEKDAGQGSHLSIQGSQNLRATDEEPDEDSYDKDMMESHLRKYRRKALNRLKENGDPECGFVSEYVPNGLLSAIKAQLGEADNHEDVSDIFRDALHWEGYP